VSRLALACALVLWAGCSRSGGNPAPPASVRTAQPPEQLPVLDAAGFTEADCGRYDGHPVTFAGTVTAKGGVQDLYYVYLKGEGTNGRRWHAIVSRDDWMRVVDGETVVLSGVLRLHSVDDAKYAVLHGAKLAE
jgi:hypothetical protein